jgi:hypothetical protein
MSISRKPSQDQIDHIISGANDEAEKKEKKPRPNRYVNLAIPMPFLRRIDALRERKLAVTSRTQWVLEAIEQRVLREEAELKKRVPESQISA